MTNQQWRSSAPPALGRARALFTSAFSAVPLHVAAAPGRVNLIGEHTDYSGGFVLPIALDRLCITALTPAASPHISRLISEHAPGPFHIDLRTPLSAERWRTLPGRPADGWTDYVVGVLALLAAHAGSLGLPVCNLDVAIASDVPLGGGLSSSASLEVSVAVAAAAAWGIELPGKACARLARHAEHAFAQVPCGIMDQYISAMGRAGHALLIDCRTQECEHIPMPPADQASVLIVNSNVRHSLASGEYAQRRDACIRAATVLGLRELRDADERAVASSTRLLLEPDLFPIARHVVTENSRTLAAAAALQRGDLAQVGSLMHASHTSLRDDYRVSCPELDSLVEFACGHAGVFGARMTGGGFGGCMVALCHPDEADSAADEILRRYRDRHHREATAFVTTAQDGAHLVIS
ncbi:MAG TPA: galactokinase [Phycisphaerales bacterium]|nr:galactokinase [Phycisphaerales bacterium]